MRSRPALPPIVSALLKPDFYPHRPPGVELVQTHISFVFLAGGEVFKLKKPVRFSFLDFSTLERRRHFCHEEVRLNRRLAPDVYRGVRSVCREGDRYRLGEENDPAAVEYAVHMRRLDESRILARLLDRGAATLEMMDAIAARIAEFHRCADDGPEVRARGDVDAFARSMEADFGEMDRFRGVTISAADDDAIRNFCRACVKRFELLLHERQRSGRVRDGHGDLHAEHVCMEDGLVIFDCIEFNPEFRCRDVAAEIAFLAMDLDYHGHRELSRRLVQSYADAANDVDVASLVPFFQCHRAYIRGKVDTLRSDEPEVGEEGRAESRRSAARHFALACRYTWSHTPALVVVVGLSGTGKSTIAKALCARTGFTHINSDVVRKELAGMRSDERPRAEDESRLYSPAMSARTYGTMFERAGERLAWGGGVVIDATFQRRIDRDEARALARRHRVPLLIVECSCDEAVIRQRLASRTAGGTDASDADWRVYEQQRRRYEAFEAHEPDDHVSLDTAAGTAEVVAAIEAELRRRARSGSQKAKG